MICEHIWHMCFVWVRCSKSDINLIFYLIFLTIELGTLWLANTWIKGKLKISFIFLNISVFDLLRNVFAKKFFLPRKYEFLLVFSLLSFFQPLQFSSSNLFTQFEPILQMPREIKSNSYVYKVITNHPFDGRLDSFSI